MSAEPIAGGAGVPPEELAVIQRVHQLQTLIEQTRQVGVGGALSAPAGASSQAPGEDFASTLRAATAANTANAPTSYTTTANELQPAGASASSAAGGAGSSEYSPLIEQAAARYGLDPAILYGLIEQESGFDPSAQSSAGAAGLTQLMPGTTASLGVANPLNPAESIEGGARYLSQLMGQFGGNVEDALAAYNAGPGAVGQYGGVPPYAETQSYVAKVLGNAETYRQSHATSGSGVGLGYTSGAPPGAPPGALAYAGALLTNSARTAIAEGHRSTAGEARVGGYEEAGSTSILGAQSDASARSPEDAGLLSLDARSGGGISVTAASTGEIASALPSNSTLIAGGEPEAQAAPAAMAALNVSAGVHAGQLPRREADHSPVPARSGGTYSESTEAEAMPTAGSPHDPSGGEVPPLPAEPLAGSLAANEQGASLSSANTSTQSASAGAASAQTVTFSVGAGTEADASPAPAPGVPMQEIIDSIHATVAMAARQGVAQARIELQPRDLGQISIRLSQTSAGLSARMSASTVAGAQALTQGSSELRQSLSSLGVSLLRLDIGSFAQPQTGEQGERFGAGAQHSSASHVTTGSDEDENSEQLESAVAPLGGARGEIVDVLA